MIRGSNLTTTSDFNNTQLKGKYISFKSFDQIELLSYLTYSSLGITKGTIILLHGIGSGKESFIGLSNRLSSLGYNSIALDSRAHGLSKGVHCTFGVKEKKDISELINVLEKQEKINENIGVWGQSLGGAIGIQALGYDKRVKFGVIESTFSDFTTITHDYFKLHLGFNLKPLTNYLIYRAGQIAGFNPKDARPVDYCKKIDQPILIVHGDKDRRIDIKYAKKNFTSIPSKEKTYIKIEKANHLNVWDVGGEEYFRKVIKFLDKSTSL
ncbi:MAG: alpha/beta hydrolase [Cyclobacteriaceae bacterium]